jgi:two-component system response regulator NreC
MDRRPPLTYRVLLVQEHKIVSEGLRALLEKAGIEVVGEAFDARSASELARTQKPEVVVLDIGNPENAIGLVRAIRIASPDSRTLLLTLFAAGPLVIEALQSGVQGYVLKTQSAEDLLRAIDGVSQGAVYISPVVAGNLVDVALSREKTREGPLTPRERQVLKLVAEGQSTREIAVELRISFKTAEYHRHRIMRRLGIHETAGLVRYAIRRGVIQA